MDIKVQCPGCSEVLLVPLDAAGKVARCPKCQSAFQVPEPNDIVEQTVSQWLDEDMDELQEEEDQQWVDRLRHEEEEKHREEDEREAETAREIERVMKGDEEDEEEDDGPDWEAALNSPAEPPKSEADLLSQINSPQVDTPEPAAPAQPSPASTPQAAESEEPATASAVVGSSTATAQTDEREKIQHAPTPHMEATSSGVQDDTVSDYPDNLLVLPTQPHLVVSRVTQEGVQLSFASRFLKHAGFRLSMPVRCAFTGNDDRKRLIVRPLAFLDRSQAQVRSAMELEAGHEHHVGDNRIDEDMLLRMGILEDLPEPFHLCFPYYVFDDSSSRSLECSTTKRSDGGITCTVLMPDGNYALDWLGRVNGICGKEYKLLYRDVERLFKNAWSELAEVVRERIKTWVEFTTDETFRYYINDADHAKKDQGLAGVVLTDKRLIFHKHHRRGEIVLGEDAKLIVKPDGNFAGLTVRTGEGSIRACRFHFNDLQKLRDAAEELGHELVISKK